MSPTIRSSIQEEADAHLDRYAQLMKTLGSLDAQCPEVLDFELPGYTYVGTSLWSSQSIVSVCLNDGPHGPLSVRLLEASGLDSVNKEPTANERSMLSEYPMDAEGTLVVKVTHPAVRPPCHKVRVIQKVRPQVIEVCGDVDEKRYEVLEYIEEEHDDDS
jgi:hypothetical protein